MTHYFPLGLIADKLSEWGRKVRTIDGGCAWDTQWGRAEITAREAAVSTINGNEIVGIAIYRHFFSANSEVAITVENAATWNKNASLSALLPATLGEEPSMVSRVSLYRGDESAAQHLYAPIMCTEAYMQPDGMLAAVRGNNPSPSYFGLSDGEKPLPYDEREFEYARERCAEGGAYATAGKDGITVEFPYDRGAVSFIYSYFRDGVSSKSSDEIEFDRLGGQTFLLMIRADSHPSLGRGLLSVLRLPISLQNRNQLINAVNKLNRWELRAFDMPPLFGAWCVDQLLSPAFVMFLPNELCTPGMPRTIVSWMGHRARRVIPELAAILGSEP